MPACRQRSSPATTKCLSRPRAAAAAPVAGARLGSATEEEGARAAPCVAGASRIRCRSSNRSSWWCRPRPGPRRRPRLLLFSQRRRPPLWRWRHRRWSCCHRRRPGAAGRAGVHRCIWIRAPNALPASSQRSVVLPSRGAVGRFGSSLAGTASQASPCRRRWISFPQGCTPPPGRATGTPTSRSSGTRRPCSATSRGTCARP
mmetsp:Transcript_90260/g.258279  ORF Transcript_90260/g.258279 Transcript_90260/m.258279 type:complete len:202 (-) Transcript_90260:680-1285(-)